MDTSRFQSQHSHSYPSPGLLSPAGPTSTFPNSVRESYPRASADIASADSQGSARPSSPSLPLLPSRDMNQEAGPSRRRRPVSHPGCVLCSLVNSAASVDDAMAINSSIPQFASPLPSPTEEHLLQTRAPPLAYPQPSRYTRNEPTILGARKILYHDDEITVCPANGKERLCSDGKHLIIVINRHCETVYDLGPAEVPLLSHILSTAERLLTPLCSNEQGPRASVLRVGFVGSVAKDPQSPHAHLHAHAMLGPFDTSLPGSSFWRRNVVFGPLNWWSIEDLRAEIRESTSNNRVKSGYPDRVGAPIDKVPDAGSLEGRPNALDAEDDVMDNDERLVMPRTDSSSSISTVKLKSVPPGYPGDPKPGKGKHKEDSEYVVV